MCYFLFDFDAIVDAVDAHLVNFDPGECYSTVVEFEQ
jgi:hypothetical protein